MGDLVLCRGMLAIYSRTLDHFFIIFFSLIWKMPYKGWNNKKVTEQVGNGYRLLKPAACPDEIYKIMIECWNKNVKVSFLVFLNGRAQNLLSFFLKKNPTY